MISCVTKISVVLGFVGPVLILSYVCKIERNLCFFSLAVCWQGDQ